MKGWISVGNSKPGSFILFLGSAAAPITTWEWVEVSLTTSATTTVTLSGAPL